tara:strand:+ start:44 stop:283 length:240 start_codon:yes stop_codon:yes gene_type:complete
MPQCAIGFGGAFSKAVKWVNDYVVQRLVDNFLRTVKAPLQVIFYVDTIMNLSGWTVLQMVLTKYGFGFLANYIFWLALL